MITVKIMKDSDTILNVRLGEYYMAHSSSKGYVLNNQIRVIFRKNENVVGNVVVKVTKILPPNTVEGEVYRGEYRVVDEVNTIAGLTMKDEGRKLTLHCEVTKVTQTSGPTLFTFFDGSGSIVGKSFVGAGVRAYPEIHSGDVVAAYVQLKVRDESLEAEVLSFRKLDENQSYRLFRRINREIEDKAKPVETSFLVESHILDALREKMQKAAMEIRKAIVLSQPIILRHHADCDGYSGAVALERAIIPLILEHNGKSAQWKLYRRSPSKAPYYEYTDVTKDLSFSIEDMTRFGQKEPLIILVDNGSTPEDLLALKKLKVYDARIVIVDHHYPGVVKEDGVMVDVYADAHVNPYLVGGDGKLTAGMMCVELARMIRGDVENISMLAGLSGVADRSSGDVFDQYVKLANDVGYSIDFLQKIAKVIDFEAHYLKFIESRGLVDDLLGRDREKQKELVELLTSDIEEREAKQLACAVHFAKVVQVNDMTVVWIAADKVTNHGEYPAVGKTVGLLHDYMKKLHRNVLTFGHGSDFLTIRVADEVDFNVNDLVLYLNEKIPYGYIEGGGHEHAGSIKFVPAAEQQVMNEVTQYVQLR